MRKYFWAFAVVALFCACSGKNAKKQGADAASDEALVLPISVWWMWASMIILPW